VCFLSLGPNSQIFIRISASKGLLPCLQKWNSLIMLIIILLLLTMCVYNLLQHTHYICKVKQSRYMPWRRLGGEEIQLLLIHDIGTRWGECSASRPDRALLPGKGPQYPLYRRLGGLSASLDTEARGKIISPLPGI
jgi:hypothetical protein